MEVQKKCGSLYPQKICWDKSIAHESLGISFLKNCPQYLHMFVKNSCSIDIYYLSICDPDLLQQQQLLRIQIHKILNVAKIFTIAFDKVIILLISEPICQLCSEVISKTHLVKDIHCTLLCIKFRKQLCHFLRQKRKIASVLICSSKSIKFSHLDAKYKTIYKCQLVEEYEEKWQFSHVKYADKLICSIGSQQYSCSPYKHHQFLFN